MDRYCSECGAANEHKTINGRELPVCPACGHIVWGHFSLAAAGMLVHEGKLLLVQRNIEPGIGHWSLPGGYMETGETMDQAVVREFFEETGLHVRPIGLLAIWQSPGGQAPGSEINNCWCVFGVELLGAPLLNPDPVEVQQARFFTPAELETLTPMGAWSRWTVRHYLPHEATFGRVDMPEEVKPYLRRPDIALFAHEFGRK